MHISHGSLNLDGRVARDDAQAGAGSVQQNFVELVRPKAAQLPPVISAGDDIAHPQTMHVSHCGLLTIGLEIVCNDGTGVSHELGQVRCLSSGGGRHVQNTLVGLRTKGHDRTHRGGALEHVVAGEVFWGGTDGNGTLGYLETNLGPRREGIEGDSAL